VQGPTVRGCAADAPEWPSEVGGVVFLVETLLWGMGSPFEKVAPQATSPKVDPSTRAVGCTTVSHLGRPTFALVGAVPPAAAHLHGYLSDTHASGRARVRARCHCV